MKIKVKLSDLINVNNYKSLYIKSNELINKSFIITKISKYHYRGKDGYLLTILFDNEIRLYRTTSEIIIREINDLLLSKSVLIDEECFIECKLIHIKLEDHKYGYYKLV